MENCCLAQYHTWSVFYQYFVFIFSFEHFSLLINAFKEESSRVTW